MTTINTITVHELSALAAPAVGDEIPIWDISESDYLKITYANLAAAVAATLAGDGLTGVTVLAVGEGDGIDVAADSVAVDVTEIIDTAYGLTNNGNDIRINLDADGGLEFNAGATRVKLPTNHGLSRSASGLALGTPSTLTAATSDAVTTTTHSHAITATADGATNHSTLLKSGASGELELDSLTVPSVTMNQATLGVAQSLITVDPANSAAQNFVFRVNDEATFNSVRDTTHQFGFNVYPVDAAKTSIYLQWEQDYQYSSGYGRSEFIVICKQPTSAGGDYVRPWQINVEHDQDLVDNFYDSDSFQWTFRTDTSDYYFNLTKTAINSKGQVWRFDGNNANLMNLPISTGGWFAALMANSANEMQLTSAGYPVRIMDDLKMGDGYIDLHNGNLSALSTKIALGWVDDARFQHHIKSVHTNSSAGENRLAFFISDATNTGNNEVLGITGDKRAGINETTPDATLDISTADAAAVPVLLLEQLDVSEEIMEIVSVAGVGNAVEAVGAKTLTTTAFLKVTVNGDVRYIPVGTIA